MSEAPTSTASAEPFGRYRLIEPIARGGMAEVFKAKSFGVEGFEKVLVIKRIVPELARHRAFVDMFVQEAKLAVRLSHANIVQVFDLGRVEGHEGLPAYYIAMEHVAGLDLQTLFDRHRRRREPLPLGLSVYVATEVAKALDHAHRRQDDGGRALGIVHRDISPHNILLSWDGDVKVTDFGIAKAADTIGPDDESGELEAARAAGKLAFMSPEQARGERTDARSDLFSLGIVIYQLLAGANPFATNARSETVRRIEAGEYPPLSLARPDTPPDLVAIVDDLLRVEPEERIGSAAELFERLVAFSYNAGERFGASDLAALLAPFREREEANIADSVLEEPAADADRTPVEIPQASTPPPPMSEPATGERREVTVLVGDLGHGPPEARARQAVRIRELLERHGAWIEEDSDEQLVAIFGLGETDGRDAEAGVRAGLVLVRERRDGVKPAAGIHSGPISVDDGGIPVRDERLINLLATAQRLARAAEGQVVVSPVAARLVRRSYEAEPLPDSLRAMSDGGLVIRPGRAERSERSKFVGRTAELKRLGSILAAATRREPQLVVVRGETGLGKSRLIEEARRRLARGAFDVAFYAASCPLNGASVPWSGLRAMLHVLCGTQEDDDVARILEVQPRLRALGLDDEQTAQMLGLLGARIKGSPDEARSILRTGFERMVESLARDRIHCFAFDDAQAIDSDTLDAILRIVRRHRTLETDPERRAGLRAVFILALRGEIPPPLARRRELHVIELGELRARDTQRLLESLLDARIVPPNLIDFVQNAAGGHPLFIDELVRELCDIGVVQVLNGKVRMKADATAVAPRTLRTLIADRVSRLQQRERRVLQGLAVLGEPAFTPMLSVVLEQALPTLDRNLTRLEFKGLVRRTGPTQVRFASPLYREIVLDAMTTSARQDLHARAAKGYDDATLPGPGEAAERRADHLVGAGQREEAVDHFWKAADEKTAADQIEAALRMMMRGLSLVDPTQRSIDELGNWLGKLAAAVSQVRQCPGLEQAISEPLRVIDAQGTERQRVMAHIHAARALGSINLFDQAFESLALADPDRLDDPELEGESLIAEAQLAARQGLFTRAAKAGERLEALGLADTPNTVMILALAKAMVGEGAQAEVLMQRVEELGEPTDLIDAVVRKKHWMLVFFNSRDFERAARAAIELTKLARSAGLRFDTAATLHNLGDIYDRLGDPARAYAAFLESLELTRMLEHDRLSNLNQMHLAFLDGLRGNADAEERLKARIRYADAKGFLWDVLEGRFLVARIEAARGDITRARTLITDVIAVAREHGQNLICVDAEELLASLP
jgi:eukaryotic-like serine/threonine-protein kinase